MKQMVLKKIMQACALVAAMVCAIQQNVDAAMRSDGLLGRAANDYGNMLNRSAGAHTRIEVNRVELESLRDDNSQAARHRRIELERSIASDQQNARIFDAVLGAYDGAINVGLDAMRSQTRIAEERAAAEGRALVWSRGIQTGIQEFFGQLRDPQVIGKLALLAAGTTLGAASMYYLAKFGYAYAEANMNKPTLVRETSRGSFSFKSMMSRLLGSDEEEQESDFGSVVLSPEIEKKVHILADDIKQTHEFGLPYQNVLFYGPPGTGKTEFARLLARYSGMDYAIISGADFSQFKNGEGIVEMHKMFDWAETTERGMIWFIDEADACFRDRATLDKDGVNLVNAFLSRTGASSNKFMIILATNYEEELDAAVRSRVHKKVPFNLPTMDERFRIIKMKIAKYVINDERTYNNDGEKVTVSLSLDRAVDDAYINTLAQNTEGFSGRDLDQMIAEVRLRAYRSGDNCVTQALIEYVLYDKKAEIAKDQATNAYQKARQQAAKNNIAVAAA